MSDDFGDYMHDQLREAQARIAKLEGLILQAELPVCPWCFWRQTSGHRVECPAFSGPGVLR
jgi:hypothetical protein